MPLFNGQYDPRRRAMISVFIASTAQHIDVSDENAAQAMIDTGTGVTCLSRRLIDRLGLQPKGMQQLMSADGRIEVCTYSIVVCFPIASNPQIVQQENGPPQVVPQEVAIHASAGILACEFTSESADFDVVLGMDVLQHYIFISQGQDFVLGFTSDKVPPLPDAKEVLARMPAPPQVH